jgi:hypothetical protein
MRTAVLLVFIAAFAPLAAAAKGGHKKARLDPRRLLGNVGTRRRVLQGRGRGGHRPGGEGIYRSFGAVRRCLGE